ncbi:MAG TPA: hypothetical protein VFQ44_10870 [Streptosporangiaceae bacterium]|nr:hypothetical protein [Streptosporangiaceae bacterium]
MQGWRGWAGEVAVVTRRSWRVVAAVLLVTVMLPVLPLAGVIAGGAAVGAAISPDGKGSFGVLAVAVFASPVLLVLVAGCGLVVARGWTGAVRAAGSARSGGPVGLREALSWSGRGSRRLWAGYVAGVGVLIGGAFLAGYLAPNAPAVPDLLVLAGPAGLLAPVLSFAPAAWRRRAPGAGGPPAADGDPAISGPGNRLAPMALVLAVVVSGEVAAALVVSWLMTSASAAATGAGLEGINGPAAAVIAGLVALPGSVLLAAATSVSYIRYGPGTSR